MEKNLQMAVLTEILPDDTCTAEMLELWREIDAAYWGGRLRPLWMHAALTPYGHHLGRFSAHDRCIELVPGLWRGDASLRRAVMLHEMAHQAQSELYHSLDAATGPRGQWTDLIHRCPSWSRAMEDWIQREQLNIFCPVWRRSTGNVWSPWVPDESSWMTWRQVEPDDTFDGRQLLDRDAARGGPIAPLAAELGQLFGWETSSMVA
jgi:hypothetical protein